LEREGIRVRLRRELAPQSSAAQAATPIADAAPPTATASTQATASSGSPDTQSAASSSSAPPARDAQAESSSASDEEAGLHMIPSPIVGTFYRAASPTSEPFVRLGSHVDPDMVVCIIEAMKLMNEIQAETSGEVVKIYVENGQPVEYRQPWRDRVPYYLDVQGDGYQDRRRPQHSRPRFPACSLRR
jgi:acetyl-CoA carboxylase biotin carboxyl carrier protein